MHSSRIETKFPQDQADRCVMCGLCLPHCPTYMKTGDENESPRGRVALMRAMARAEVPLNAKLESHLAGCLACRACENVCPSMVEFGALIEAGRSFIETRRPRPTWSQLSASFLLEWLVPRQRKMRLLAGLLRLYQCSGLQRLMRAAGVLHLAGLAQLDAALPALGSQKQWKTVYPAHGETRARIAFFTGCIASVVDQETLAASIRVLNLLGYEVHLPRAQTCCGALHLHAGRREQAEALMRRNIAAFAEAPGLLHGASETVAIVYAASGCGATLAEYPRHLPQEPQVRPFAARVTEISRFIAEAPWPDELVVQPLAKTIAVQDPCSLRNVVHGERWPYALLDKIPGVHIEALAGNHVCCGGAGAYPLTQPQMANRLRADKLEYIRNLAPDIIVSANIGCALHLGAGLNQVGSTIEVTHPVVVLARQLRRPQTPP